MSTILFGDIIFGPVKSRRLGVSLGVNLLPTYAKLCNFDCIYCECGWTENRSHRKLEFNEKEAVIGGLRERLSKMKSEGAPLDVITFAGNGEPTMHPDFAEIIDRTVALRDEFFPNVKVAVLSNATMIGKPEIRKALEKVDRAILKIDSAFPETIRLINGPRFDYSLDKVVENMKLFHNEVIVQTMFLRGEYKGERVDNTTEKEVSAWLEVLKEIAPKQVMIYSIDRETPADSLEKVSCEDMETIAGKVRNLGMECTVSC